MAREKLVEITKGNTGTGLLIENDGFISLDLKENKQLKESIEMDGEWHVPYPFIVSAVFQKFGIENGNGRIYPESILKREVAKYMKAIEEKRAYGENNHPDSSSIDISRISLNIVELHWEGHTLVGKIELPITYGFRKYGIVSCEADLLAHWIISGLKMGVSSRGLGSVSQDYGKLIVGDDFELVGWDAVTQPSTPGAWIDTNEENLQQYKEAVSTDKPVLKEDKYTEFEKWLND